jgi:predicted Zn-dependent protease
MEKFLADIIDLLKLKGVDYGDARVVETQTESIVVKNGIVEGITKSVDTGFGVYYSYLSKKMWITSPKSHSPPPFLTLIQF